MLLYSIATHDDVIHNYGTWIPCEYLFHGSLLRVMFHFALEFATVLYLHGIHAGSSCMLCLRRLRRAVRGNVTLSGIPLLTPCCLMTGSHMKRWTAFFRNSRSLQGNIGTATVWLRAQVPVLTLQLSWDSRQVRQRSVVKQYNSATVYIQYFKKSLLVSCRGRGCFIHITLLYQN